MDQQLFCFCCRVVLMPLCVFPQLWFQEQSWYKVDMCGTTTAEVKLSPQLFVELLPLFTGISKMLSFPYNLKFQENINTFKS